MFEYRVTKYDPKFRDPSGVYVRDEWTRYSDVGRSVSLDDYLFVEANYVNVAVSFLREACVERLRMQDVENSHRTAGVPDEGTALESQYWVGAFRSVLREDYWCRFESDEAFVHFGWDYYMYIGVTRDCPGARGMAESSGLFIEECSSPYAAR